MSIQPSETAGADPLVAAKRAAVTAVSTKAPSAGLTHLFDNPPLVGDERREHFERFFSAIAETVKPVDDIAWLLTWDVACHSWEIRRERIIKVGIIRSAQIQVVARLLGSGKLIAPDDSSPHLTPLTKVHYQARQWLHNAEALPQTTELLARNGYGHSEILAEAYIIGAPSIDAVERRLASHEARRMAALREVENRNARFARNLEIASARTIDAEVSDTCAVLS